MSRKQKIIVSITGIVLVSLILIGLTYAYFLTVITGNTNTKSINVNTANLVLEYGENTNVVQGINNAEPGYEVSKIFTATNKGNSTVTYGAVLENIVNELSRQQDLVYTLTCTSYLKSGFSLSSDGTIIGTEDGTCNGLTTEKQFPGTSTLSVMTTNSIDTTHTHAYKLIVTYKEMNVDQSEDMNKTFSAKVNIVDLRANADKINPYSANKTTLNYQIINSAIEGGTNRTTYGSEVTEFTSISGEDERVLNTAPDDYGTSYYFRGNVIDNYVSFGNLTYKKDIVIGYSDDTPTASSKEYSSLTDCQSASSYNVNCTLFHKNGDLLLWRIVRINGDGSIRLVLEDTIGSSLFNGSLKNADVGKDNAYIGYMYGTLGSSTYDATHENKNNSVIKQKIDDWYKTNIVDTNNSDYVADTLFCGDKELASDGYGSVETQLGYGNKKTYYATSERVNSTLDVLKPTYKCAENANNNYSRYTVNSYTLPNGNQTNGDLTYPVALLSADDIVFAGASSKLANKKYYLFRFSVYDYWWSMSPSFFYFRKSSMWHYNNGELLGLPNYTPSIRPSLNLKASVIINSGDGTKDNPYIVKLS